MSKLAQSFRDLEAYQAAFAFQQNIFNLSKKWPGEEKYALTNQVRRSSRSIEANLAEAWAKRRYPAHFLSKLTDSDGELQESLHWIDTAFACGYLSENDMGGLIQQAQTVGGMLGSMIRQYESFRIHQ